MANQTASKLRFIHPDVLLRKPTDWPADIGVAVWQDGDDITGLYPYHVSEDFAEAAARIYNATRPQSDVNLTEVGPLARDGVEVDTPDLALVGKVEDMLRIDPEKIEHFQDFSVNFEFARGEGLSLASVLAPPPDDIGRTPISPSDLVPENIWSTQTPMLETDCCVVSRGDGVYALKRHGRTAISSGAVEATTLAGGATVVVHLAGSPTPLPDELRLPKGCFGFAPVPARWSAKISATYDMQSGQLAITPLGFAPPPTVTPTITPTAPALAKPRNPKFLAAVGVLLLLVWFGGYLAYRLTDNGTDKTAIPVDTVARGLMSE